jgi:hypothetical protein
MIRNIVTIGLSDVEASVVKSTYDDKLVPKEKHCQRLIDASADHDMIRIFEGRLTMLKWNVIFKTLIVVHRLCNDGSLKFLKDLSARAHIFSIRTPLATTIHISNHLKFIDNYYNYLELKLFTYKLTETSIERMLPNTYIKWVETLTIVNILRILPVLLDQINKLLLCEPYSLELESTEIPLSALKLLIKDAFRIYSVIPIIIVNIVEKYYDMSVSQTMLAINCAKKFKEVNIKFKKWTISLGEIGVNTDNLLPTLVPVPNTLFEILNTHIKNKSEKTTVTSSLLKYVPDKPCKKNKKQEYIANESSDSDDFYDPCSPLSSQYKKKLNIEKDQIQYAYESYNDNIVHNKLNESFDSDLNVKEPIKKIISQEKVKIKKVKSKQIQKESPKELDLLSLFDIP